jgi:Carboxypeptidase regulatory-like domain/TonB dependent receptor
MVLVCSLFVASTTGAFAQNATGTITGVVRDPSNAVLPATHVTVNNESTGLTRKTVANQDGEYRVPFLPVGIYSIRVEKEGFKAQVQTGISLDVQQVRSVDFALQLGTVNETVTVESHAPLLDTATSQAGQVIKNEQITNLPLNVRQFMQLTYLAPMAVPAARDFRSTEVNRDTSMPASAGQRPEQNNYQIDGIDNKENGRNNVAITPPVDSVSEFKVQTGMAPAEFGRGGGTIINVVTKNGTNEFHGTAYEFLRNNKLDARSFFSDRKSPLKRNQFGGAIGGPVVRNKLLFFANYEGLRQASSGNPPVGKVFTANERNGIFTTPVKDPFTGAPFPNNTIPQSRFDPISQNILKLIPLPNNPGDAARNFIFNDVPSGHTPRNAVVGRTDYMMSSKDTLFGRYLFDQEVSVTPPQLPAPALSNGRNFSLRAQSASAHWNHVVGPNMVNSFTLGFTRYRNQNSTLNAFKQDFVATSGITNTLAAVNPLFWGTPIITIPGYLMTSEVTGNFRSSNNFQLQDSVLWNKGRHTIKLGADVRDIRAHLFYTSGNGSIQFQNSYSGNNVSDFLLGVPSQVVKTARAPVASSHVRYLGTYIQDDWKLAPKLTLNLGLRYEVESAARFNDNGMAGFDVSTGTIVFSKYVANLPAIQAFYKNIRPDLPYRISDHRSPYDADTNNIAPRIGLAYNVAPRTVIRAGYGIFYDSPQIEAFADSSFAPNLLGPVWTADPLKPGFGYNPEGAVSAEESLRTAALTPGFPFLTRDFKYGKVQQWMLSIQHQLNSRLVAEVLYQGSNTVHLLVFDNINIRPPGPGNVQQTLRWPGYIRTENYADWARAGYNGAAVKIEQRPWHGLSYLAAYTFSKSIDQASTVNVDVVWVDPFNYRTAFGPSDFDARNRFSLAWEYALPFGKGKALLNGLPGVADKFLGGWGVRGITFLQTGLPQSPSENLSRNGVCAVSCSARPDRIANGNLDKDVRTINRFYDAAAFRLNAPGGADRRVGNSGRNVLIGPGTNNIDLQIFKDTRIHESQRLEFRWEMFNAFNHTQWSPPATNLESPATFGVITATAPPRIMQVVLKYSF